MSIAAEFKTRGIVRGGILILGSEAALAMIDRARALAVPILGIDGFWITDQTTQPDMANSVDLGRTQSTWNEAEDFIRSRAHVGLMFEVVADEDTADLRDGT